MRSRKVLSMIMAVAMRKQPRTGSADLLSINGEILLDIRELLIEANKHLKQIYLKP